MIFTLHLQKLVLHEASLAEHALIKFYFAIMSIINHILSSYDQQNCYYRLCFVTWR